MSHEDAYSIALQVIQQAVNVLALWSNKELANKLPVTKDKESAAVTRAKKILSWNDSCKIEFLKSLFDSVKLESGQDNQHQTHYWYPQEIADNYPRIPYPQDNQPIESDFGDLKEEVKSVINSLDTEDWENLSLLTLILEKYGSFISFGDKDIALIDIAKSTAAVAAALTNNPDASKLTLIAGGLSGIQNFIYTISSDGALKSLRARSFYLELVTEEVVQQVLGDLKLPHNNVIYAGGSNLYILASGDVEGIEKSLNIIRQRFNKWLLKEFDGKISLNLDYLDFPTEDIVTKKFAEHWSDISQKLNEQKSRKFSEQIAQFIQPKTSYEPCKVCHRDDDDNLEILNPDEADSPLACKSCRDMFSLGGKLFKLGSIVRSKNQDLVGKETPKLSFNLPAIGEGEAIDVYYYLFESWQPIIEKEKPETVFLINDWEIKHYKFKFVNNPVPLLLGNYGKVVERQEKEGKGFIRSNEMADAAQGIPRVGHLRMDVDRLGRIFAEGLGEKKTLPRIAGLSRQMSYFFKVYLNSLAEFRNNNKPINRPIKFKQLTPDDERLNLLFIYAGGDDLFVSGAWNEVVEFGFDVYQCFRAFTGNNPDITLSGGICIADAKFPLYQAAKQSGKAEDAAKDNGRDSLGLFGEVFKWDEWLGIDDVKDIKPEILTYLNPDAKPELLGVLPFVEILEHQQIGFNYSRNFVRNLLATAQIQKQAVKKIKDRKIDEKSKKEKDKLKAEIKETRYFLHLPKVAYTLARLPTNVLDNPDFRKSLKSPYNAPYFRAIATWIELLNRS